MSSADRTVLSIDKEDRPNNAPDQPGHVGITDGPLVLAGLVDYERILRGDAHDVASLQRTDQERQPNWWNAGPTGRSTWTRGSASCPCSRSPTRPSRGSLPGSARGVRCEAPRGAGLIRATNYSCDPRPNPGHRSQIFPTTHRESWNVTGRLSGSLRAAMHLPCVAALGRNFGLSAPMVSRAGGGAGPSAPTADRPSQ